MTPEQRGQAVYDAWRWPAQSSVDFRHLPPMIAAAIREALEDAAVALEALERRQMRDGSASALVRAMKGEG